MALNPGDFDRIAAQLSVGRDPASVRRRIEAMEILLERAFLIPGTRRGIGLDSIVGLIPIVGDLVTAAMGGWLIWEARNLGMSKFHLARMAAILGSIPYRLRPLLGDAADFLFRSNSRNLRIVRSGSTSIIPNPNDRRRNYRKRWIDGA